MPQPEKNYSISFN